MNDLEAIDQAQLARNWPQVVELVRAALARDQSLSVLHRVAYAYALRQLGFKDEAIAQYQQVLQEPNVPAPVYFNLGNIFFDQGAWERAQSYFEQALTVEPDLHAARLQLARCAVKLNQMARAREQFETVLLSEPANYTAQLEVGHIYRQQAEQDKSIQAYRSAVDLQPQRWQPRVALIRVLEETGALELAAAEYQRAHTLLTPQAASELLLHWYIARYRLERGEVARAMEALRYALSIARNQPSSADENLRANLMLTLASALMRLNLREEAVQAMQQAAESTDESVLTGLAELALTYNLGKEAIALYRRNVQVHPRSAPAHFQLAECLARVWQMQEALNVLAYAKTLSNEPWPEESSMRATVATRMGDSDTALAIHRESLRNEGPYSKLRSRAAMCALYSDKLSAQEVADLHRELFAGMGANARSARSFKNNCDPDRPLRLGVVSADFHYQHPVDIFMQPVLARFNPQLIHTTVYFTGSSHDSRTDLAKRRVQQWVECGTWTDSQLAQRIERDEIDVLLDLAGHTGMQRMAVFAQRAAPVQVTFLGYPGSTGVPNMDWVLVDNVVAPPGSESLFSEQLARLPHTVFCFAPEQDYPYPDYGPAQAKRPLTFGSFNNVAKLTAHTINLWAQVLKAVPQSRMLLKAPSFEDMAARDSFIQRFAQHGIDASRLEFRGPVGLQDMMAEYADVDIALDAVPYNGGTTTLQAMWMGVPVVVRAGHNFSSRMGMSFMQAAQMPDWIAQSDEDYVRIAVQHASNRKKLLEIKKNLRPRLLQLPGWNADIYAQDFYQQLRMMWRQWCQR